MAPNVKQVFHLIQHLEDVDFLQPKYLPLTMEEEWEGHHSEPKVSIQKETITTATSDSSSYWDWPSQDDSLFQSSRIEKNIIREAEVLRSKSNNVVVADHSSSNVENYWDENDVDYTEQTLHKELHHEIMTVKEKIVMVEETRDDSYWNWDRISHPKEEVEESHDSSYWNWDRRFSRSDRAKEEEKSIWIEKILAEKRLRDMLSSQRVVELMEKSHEARLPITSCRSVSGDYWFFSAEEDEAYHYYWDWGNNPDTESYWAM